MFMVRPLSHCQAVSSEMCLLLSKKGSLDQDQDLWLFEWSLVEYEAGHTLSPSLTISTILALTVVWFVWSWKS